MPKKFPVPRSQYNEETPGGFLYNLHPNGIIGFQIAEDIMKINFQGSVKDT